MIEQLIISGDSFVEGVGDKLEFGGWTKRIGKSLPNIRVDTYGFGGQTVKDLERRFHDEIKDANNSIVVFQIGLNDSRIRDSLKDRNEVELNDFNATYNSIIDECKKRSGILYIILIGLTLVDEFVTIPYKHDKYYSNYQILKFDQTIEKISKLNNVKYIKLSDLISDTNDTLADGVHPNNIGHEIIADKVMEAIKSYVQFK